jgi:hypothetical protein
VAGRGRLAMRAARLALARGGAFMRRLPRCGGRAAGLPPAGVPGTPGGAHACAPKRKWQRQTERMASMRHAPACDARAHQLDAQERVAAADPLDHGGQPAAAKRVAPAAERVAVGHAAGAQLREQLGGVPRLGVEQLGGKQGRGSGREAVWRADAPRKEMGARDAASRRRPAPDPTEGPVRGLKTRGGTFLKRPGAPTRQVARARVHFPQCTQAPRASWPSPRWQRGS